MSAITRNAEKESKAVEIIKSEIIKFSETQKADYGTMHYNLGYTKRHSVALLMAQQFVKMLYKIEPSDDENNPTEIERRSIIGGIVAAALS